MSNADKSVVITGVSRGIGLALAVEYLLAGFSVFGCARSKPGKTIENRKFHFRSLDVCDYNQAENWARDIFNGGNAPKTLINNAAIINETLPLWEIPVKDFDLLIDINIKGVANFIRAFVPEMIEKESGTIVNMSSGWGRTGAANVSSYCASKFAIEGLTQSLSQELPRPLVTISLSPGVVKTQMLESCAPQYYEGAIDANSWAKKAVPFIEGLSIKQNGKALTLGDY